MTTAKDTLGVGFVGAGDISVLHARAVARCPGARLVGLWNRGQDRAKQRAGEFGCRNYASPEELVRDPAVDAVFVLTNLETHLEICHRPSGPLLETWQRIVDLPGVEQVPKHDGRISLRCEDRSGKGHWESGHRI